MTVLHLSDLHFGTERPDAVRAVLTLAQAVSPQAIIVSGDITQRARPREFAAAQAFFEALPAVPLLIVPGNHDIPLFNLLARVWRPYAAFARACGRWGAMERTWSAPGWQITTVNTTRPWRHKHGEVSVSQIDRVAAALRQAGPEQARLVVVHQPMAVPADRPDERADLLRGARPLALARWAEAGADVIVGGHIHLPYILPIAGLARPLTVVQAGTAVSSRTRHDLANSLYLYGREGRALTVQRWDYARGAFACAQHTVLALQRP